MNKCTKLTQSILLHDRTNITLIHYYKDATTTSTVACSEMLMHRWRSQIPKY